MDIVEIKKVVARIKSALFKNSNSYAIGMLRSHFRGTGLQFKEHQIYHSGDEVRFIDWKILAKTKVPYIKTFEEERNVEIVVIIDASVTMLSGSDGISKLQAAIEICCLLYLLAAETHDFIHVTILTDEISYIPKKVGEEGIAALIALLRRKNILLANGSVNLELKYEKYMDNRDKAVALMKHLAKRREIVLLSDFNDFLDEETLRRIAYKKNVHCFQLTSPLDEASGFPYLINTFDNLRSLKGTSRHVNFSGGKEYVGVLGKKAKKLRVHQRYMEEFIKEML